MILATLKELYVRFGIIALSSIIILIIEAQYINELILLLFDPIKQLNDDWYTLLLHHIINNTFKTFDTELQPNYIHEYTVDYIPSCEITMQGTIVHQTVTILTIHISIITITAIIWYNVVLYTIPSMFTFEKNMHIKTFILTSCIFIYTIVSTHYIWTRIFVIASFHSYTEFNYYEFDVDFDMHSYICKYIYTIYITFGLLCFITNKKHITYKTISIILIALATLQIINISEIIYYTIITITYFEIRNFKYIINKKRNNLYTLVLWK